MLKRIRGVLAGSAVVAILAGTFVVVGMQAAQAASPAPAVSAAPLDPPLIAGADASLGLNFTNQAASGTGQYNLSVGIVLPLGVEIVNPSGLGAPTRTFPALTVLAGTYALSPAECAAMGLEAAPGAPNKCRVPAGAQYTVFENVSDLPDSASNPIAISLRPDASVFPVGSEIPYTVSGFTSSDATLLPLIPGGTGRATSDAHSYGPGAAAGRFDVEAFRISKSTDLRENELLRGVHENQASYTLTVRHTGEGDVSSTEVIDYLPAWLEYLGDGSADHTENANGVVGQTEEYPGSGPLNTHGPLAGYVPEQSVETVSLTDAEAQAAGLGENAGGVYTKVVWNLGTLLASAGVAQTLPAAGAPGELTIRYRAGIPLFANTMDFPNGTPSPTGRTQAANLDNNSGESTRQGQNGDPWTARWLVNTAIVEGDYTVPGQGTVRSSAIDSEAVEALDVSLVKSVDRTRFEQGEIAEYTVEVRASEYVDASLDVDGTNSILPNRFIDDMGDGVCPVFPPGVPITAGQPIPNLVLGALPLDPVNPNHHMTEAAWNAALGAAASDCRFPSTNPLASFSVSDGAGNPAPGAGALTSIGFNGANGHFYLEFAIADLAAGQALRVQYTAAQNSAYSKNVGGTSSGDRVHNTAVVTMTTSPSGGTAGVTNANGTGVGDDMRATDDSAATLQAGLSELTKDVLPRSAGAVNAAGIANPALAWEPELAPEPFMVGDEVWYRLNLTPPTRADVRNPILSDMLPNGVVLAGGALVEGSNYVVVPPSGLAGLGDLCQTAPGGGAWTESAWLAEFVPAPTVAGSVITWRLGSTDCVTGNAVDRYLPSDAELTVYIKGLVVGAAETGTQDLTQNLVKYQQQSRDGETSEIGIDFMRDSAGIEIVGTPSLVKGIETNGFAGIANPVGYQGAAYPAGTSGNAFNSNRDGENAVGGDEVSFRLDVTLPESARTAVGSTAGYEIWDALPVGMTKADLTGAHGGVLVVDGSETAAIPAGDISFTAYDPGDPGRPSDVRSAYAGRTVVVWRLDTVFLNSVALVPEVPGPPAAPAIPGIQRGFSLKYAVEVPQDASNAVLQQRYENTASIVQFAGLGQSGTGAGTVVVPVGDNTLRANTDASVADLGAYPVPSTGTVDSSSLVVPNAAMWKRLVSTEIGPSAAVNPPANTVGLNDLDAQNTQTRIAQGELATYEYLVRIPAGTTVKNGVLSDDGLLRGPSSLNVNYVVVGAKFFKGAVELTTCPAGFTCSASDGRLAFPASYENTSGDFEEYRVQLTVHVRDADATTPGRAPNIPHAPSANLVNTARFASTSVDGGANTALSATANAQYIEPNLGLAKSHDKTGPVSAGEVVTYTLTVTNSGADRAASYDNRVVDTVPAGLQVNVAALEAVYPNVDLGTPANRQSLIDGLGGTIVWPADVENADGARILAKIAGGGSVALTYQAAVVPSAGASQSFDNTARVTGYTLPNPLDGADTSARRGDRTATSNATVTAVSAGLAKGVRIKGGGAAYGASASAPIGATAEYEVAVTLYKNITYYGARIVDQLPAGVALVPGSVSVTVADPVSGMTAADWGLQTVGPDNRLRWDYVGDASGDLAPAAEDRTVTLRYEVLLANTVAFGVNSLPNTAGFSWGTAPNAPEGDRKGITQEAGVTVLNPALQVVKRVDGSTSEIQRNPDATLPYAVTVTNTGQTPAHALTVVDCVPANLVVDPSTITMGGSLGAPTVACPGGVISWTLAGPLQHQSGSDPVMPKSIQLGYSARFAASASLQANASSGLGSALTNVVDVTRFESYETGGRVYQPGTGAQPRVSSQATARPIFPRVTLLKEVAGGTTTAHVGEPFGWRLTVANTGRGPAQTVAVSDVLPKNWVYDAGSARIKVGTGAEIALADPTVAPGTGADAGKSVLTWNLGAAVPGTPAIQGAASGQSAAQRTTVITFTATPQAAATSDAGAGLTVPHTNTLRATVTDTQGATRNATATSYTDADKTASAYLGRADLAIAKVGAGAPIHAGTTATGWTITVTNNGPDTAEGSITVTDTTSALPAGVTVGQPTGTGWSCTAPSRDATTGETGFDCARTNVADSLANGASFPAITVPVTVDPSQPSVAANVITNTARVVPGRTYDSNPNNNEASDDITIDNLADLTISKTVVNPAPANVGETITWQIEAWNAGPSVSRSTTANPITITDTVPAGVGSVTASSNADWAETLDDGSPIPAGGVGAGTTIRWTYQHAEMAKLPARPLAVTLTGTVLTSHTGPLANTATVTPRITPEPTANPLTNTSTVTVTPRAEMTLAVGKERVVPDGQGGWRTADPATHPEDAFVAGNDVSYRIAVTNNGQADAQNVQVVDEVPAGLAYKAPHANISGTWTRTAGGTTSTGTNAAWDTFALGGTQPAGSVRTFVVTYTTAPTTPASVLNCAEATGGNWDTTSAAPRFARACNDSAATRVVDLGIVKTHSGTGPFDAGTAVSYTLTVTNHGPSASSGPFTVTDALPEGMSYVEDSARIAIAGGTPAVNEPALSGAGDRMLTWTVTLPGATTLAPGATIVVTLDALLDPSVRALNTLANTATVTGNPAENEPTGEGTWPNTDTDSVTTRTSAAMSIAKAATAPAAGPWIAGTDVTYTLTIENDGPSEAPAGVVDTLPSGLSFVSMGGTGWTCPVASPPAAPEDAPAVPTGSCTYTGNAGLHPLGTSTITVVARIASNVPPTAALPAPGLVNTAVLTWSDSDGSHSDDDDAEIRVTTDADLGLVKHVIDGPGGDVLGDDSDPATAVAGRTLWYRILVSNHGASDAAGPVVVVDELPEGITVPTTLTAVGPWEVAAGTVDPLTNRQTVTFTLAGGLAAGTADEPLDAPVIEFEADLDPAIADDTLLVNSATVSSETADSNPANDADPADVLVTRSADLAIAKSHESDERGQVRIDEPLDFTILVTNNGSSVASGITVTDTIPAGLEVVSAVGPVLGAADEPSGWTIDSIDLVDPEDPTAGVVVVASYDGVLGVSPDDSAAPPLVITTIPRESALGTDPNHAAVAGDEFDPVLENNEVDDPIDVRPRVTLLVDKTVVGEFQVGKIGEYRITVSNTGPHADPGPITVKDALPAGLSFDAAPDLPGGVSFSREGEVLTWTIEEGLAVGAKVELRLLVNVGEAAHPSIANTAVVDSPAEKTPESVLSSTATAPVLPPDPLSLTGAQIGLGVGIGALLLAGGLLLALRRRERVAA